VNEILDKMVIGRSCGEVTAASHPQRLIECLFEPMMGLFHIAIFMRHPGIVPGGLHALMGHQCLIANCPIFLLFFAQLPHGGA
jgi:hypothetical protein